MEKKAFWASKGFWGPAVALAALGIQQGGGPEIDQSASVEWILQGVQGLGVLLGLYGRTVAKAPLGLKSR